MRRIFLWLRPRLPKLAILFGGVLLPLYLFGELGGEVIEKEPFFFDRPVLLFLHGHANTTLDAIMLFFTRIGAAPWLMPVELLVFSWLLYKRRHPDALFLFISVTGAATLNFLTKNFFARTRPDLWISLRPETTFSFPSGHAMNAMAIAAALIVLSWHSRWRWPVAVSATAFVLMVSLSRVYLGVHYPSDILAGWTASLAWVVGLTLILRDRPAPAP